MKLAWTVLLLLAILIATPAGPVHPLIANPLIVIPSPVSTKALEFVGAAAPFSWINGVPAYPGCVVASIVTCRGMFRNCVPVGAIVCTPLPGIAKVIMLPPTG